VSSQSWLDEFKLALIEEDLDSIALLNEELPEFDDVKQMQEAQAYIKQAAQIILQRQNELRKKMNDIAKAKKYLNS